MSEKVTLDLPDTLARSVRVVAAQTQRSIEDVLLEWLDRVLTDIPVESLPDSEVIALRDSQMPLAQQQELSNLLAQQREAILSTPERQQLDTLLGIYRRGMVRRARALKTAVDRGLQPPLGQY